MTVIDHRTQASPGGQSNLKLVYSYDRRNLPTQIFESSETGLVAPTTTVYTYDARGRLVAESRSTPDTNGIAYDLEYDYDAGGNRIEKRDLINNRRVVYTYDFTDPALYKSANNRLMFYQTQQLDGTLLSTTYYFYNGIGNPTNVVTELETPLGNSPKFSATRFIYAANAQTVTFMIGETWDPGTCYSAYNITFAREFRYDQARRRYLDRELNPAGLMTSPQTFVTLSETWTDYDDDNAYGDFTVTGGAITQAKQYEPGLGTIDDPTGSPVTKYLHNDHLGTLRTTSTATGSAESLRVFTAFGEKRSNDSQRYGYAGSWGYQSNAGSSLLHVGARYYDPAIGRFLQRDPIGLLGGLNVYGYVSGQPVVLVDPSGLVGGEGQWERYKNSVISSRKIATKAYKNRQSREVNEAFLFVTGGRNSWLDNPSTVNNVQWGIDLVCTPIVWAAKVTTAIRWIGRGLWAGRMYNRF